MPGRGDLEVSHWTPGSMPGRGGLRGQNLTHVHSKYGIFELVFLKSIYVDSQ